MITTSSLPFPPELRTASIVPRWSVVWTLNRDYVSNHSFFVTMYAHDIARLIEWRGNYAALMYFALVHDLEETISGDLVSPVKREILDYKRAGAYLRAKMQERMPSVMTNVENYEASISETESEDIDAIIKVADRLDALLFLITEQRLGNTVIGPRTPDAEARLEAAWRDLPHRPGCKADIDHLWQTAVLPSIRAHRDRGGFGI